MAKIIPMMRDPAEVRRGEMENAAVLGAIHMGRALNLGDDRIADAISELFHLTLPRAKIYMDKYDQELAHHILPWEAS